MLSPEEWRDVVAGGKPCVICGHRMGVKAHHIVYQQVIRRIAEKAGIDPAAWLWDPRNGLPVCSLCHGNHHSGARPIPRPVLVEQAPQVFQFARELGPEATDQIRRRYPLPALHRQRRET